MRPRYEDPTFASIESDGRMTCPCGGRFLFPCDRQGRMTAGETVRGLLRLCVACYSIITADAVVIGQREVTV